MKMDFKENWIKWEPIKGLSGRYYLDFVLKDNGLKIILSEENDENKVQVSFEGSLFSYLYTDETFRSKTLLDLSNKYGDNFYVNWTFFKIKDSFYLEWKQSQSCGISEYYNFIHFCFFTLDTALDVISPYEPKVEIIKIN